MPELNLNYVHSLSMGYGRYGTYLSRELENLGVTVYDDMPGGDGMPRLNDGDKPENAKSGISNVVCWVSTPTHAKGWYKDQIPVMSTMWEATVLPESFRENIHNFETLIVPSWHNVELFSQYHDNVKFVPLGIDPQDWHYVPRTDPGQFFTFLIGGSGPRKGTDLAFDAFQKAFPDPLSMDPMPRLVLKNPRGEEFYGDNVEVLSGRIPAEDEIALYEQAHCYIQPSRGEGFGLQPLQALAQGLPTILTAAHGHEAFAHLGRGLSSTLAKSAYFIFGDAGEWWEPDLDELVDQMRDVYENYTKAKDEARASAQIVAEQWKWADTARKFVNAIGPDRLTSYAGSTEWIKPPSKRYLVITLKDWACDIVGRRYQFRKGQKYWESADVKRILFEAEILDPACLRFEVGSEEDLGLAPEQLAELGDYSATHSTCLLCHQPINPSEVSPGELVKVT